MKPDYFKFAGDKYSNRIQPESFEPDERLTLLLSSAYKDSLSSPKRRTKSHSLLWFMLSIPSLSSDSYIRINEREGYIDISLNYNLEKLYLSDINGDDIIKDMQLNIKNSILFLGASSLKTNINNIKLIGDIDVETYCLDDDCNETDKILNIYYTASSKNTYRLIAPVLGAIFGDYIGLYGSDVDVNTFYSDEYNRRYINPHKLDEVPEIKKAKDELMKLGYIDEHYIPNVSKYTFKTIRDKISELFKQKKVCAVCGKEFVAGRDNQVVCSSLRCQKRQNRIKKMIRDRFVKDTPKKEIIAYLMNSEDKTYKKFKNSKTRKFDKIKDWDVLIDKLSEDLGWQSKSV